MVKRSVPRTTRKRMYSPASDEVVVELLEPSLRVSRGPALGLHGLRAEPHARRGAAGRVARRHVRAVRLARQAVGRRRVGGRAAARAGARRRRLLVVLLQARPQLGRRQLEAQVRGPLYFALLLRVLSIKVSR